MNANPDCPPLTLDNDWFHLCIDMQRMFAEDTPWHMPWMEKAVPNAVRIAAASPERTAFTRFIPLHTAEEGIGMWKDYYRKWSCMTLETMKEGMTDLVPDLSVFVPPAMVFDKQIYSPWLDGRLHRALQQKNISTLFVTGGETDVCVLATVIGAVDLGYRIILVHDAVCSSSDEAHDAILALYQRRYGIQVSVYTAREVVEAISGCMSSRPGEPFHRTRR